MKHTHLAICISLMFATLHAQAESGDSTSSAGYVVLPTATVTADPDAVPLYNPPTARSATKIDAPLRDIPQTVNVVPQELMRDQGVRSMQDVMRSVPGVGLSNGDGQRDQVTIRGFNALADQFIDGFRDDALYFRDLSNVEQVEVLKGPASVLYGRGSSGGLINRVTKKPGVDNSEAIVQFGSWNQRRGEFDLGRTLPAQGAAFRLTGAIERADSYRDQGFLEREAFAPSVLFGLTNSTSLLIQLEHLYDRRITDFGIPSFQGRPVNVPASTYYGAANAREADYSKSEVDSLTATLTHRLNDQWSFRNGFRYYKYDLDRHNTLVGSVNETAQTASLTHGDVRRVEDGFFNQSEFTQQLAGWGLNHQILYGLELAHQSKDQFFLNRTNVATVNLFNPQANAPVLPTSVEQAPTTFSNFDTTAVYLQDLVELDVHWKALVGVRFDQFDQETTPPVGRSLVRTDRQWSPRAGVVYQPNHTQSYYASVSRSFQPSGETFALAANNEQLAPEQTTNREIGAKFDFLNGKASATASLFQLERTNIKFTDPTTNQLVPVGTQETRGFELSLTGDLSGGWLVWAGYAYLDGQVTSSPSVDNSDNRTAFKNMPIQGKRPTLTPQNSANLWVTKKLASGWRTGAGLNYVDDRFANPGNTVTLPAYTVLDAMLGYTAGDLDIQFNLNNLLDEDYIISGHGSSPNLNTPGAPRSVQVTARLKF